MMGLVGCIGPLGSSFRWDDWEAALILNPIDIPAGCGAVALIKPPSVMGGAGAELELDKGGAYGALFWGP